MTGRYLPKFLISIVFFLIIAIIVPTVLSARSQRDHPPMEPPELSAYPPASNPLPPAAPLSSALPEPPGSVSGPSGAGDSRTEPPESDLAGHDDLAGLDDLGGLDRLDDPDIIDGSDISVADGRANAYEWMPGFVPYATENTIPSKMIASTAIMADGQIVDSYVFPETIDFSFGDVYSELEGITAFRGNNFRDCASYGTADIVNAKFGRTWSSGTGSLTAPDGAYWSGNGWSGQPLIVKWPKETRNIMNMYQWAKEADGLVEVIYPSMDGYIYFSELETGAATRDKLYIGYTFKGAGTIDPRGYPLLYVGAGYASSKGAARIFIISLVDGSVLHTFGSRDAFAQRSWSAADASPLVDAATDTLIYPSENGIIYFIKLNSVFDIHGGTVSVEPSPPVKWRFEGKRSQKSGMYWLGMEASPVIWRGCLVIPDNGGHLICLDIGTLTLIWVRDVLDDTNDTPVLELENGHPYIYLSTEFHGGWRAEMDETAPVPIWKIDALTGEEVWRTDYLCRTSDGVSGGVLGTIAVGKHDLAELVFVPVARTPSYGAGILAALDKRTGEVVWELRTTNYSWSSPVCVYDNDGKGYVILCTAGGFMYLVDGLTGEIADSIKLGGTIEASPAVYGNMVVVGTRAMKIWGVELT